MRITCHLLLIVSFLILQTGCWDAKEIQSINYATAIGVDYVDNRYVVYLQILDFNSVAKKEGASPGKASVWVGKGTGVTPNEAVYDLYSSSQQMIFWGNVTAMVLSERVLNKGIEEILDLANRYREIRYTKWMFGTNDSIEHILSVTPFFRHSPLSSILHEPSSTYRQLSLVAPIRMNAFISQFHEPMTILLPRLSTTKKIWVENEKPHEMLYIKGAYLIDKTLIGPLSESSLRGLRWMNVKTVRSPILIKSGGKQAATLIGTKPKHEIGWGVKRHKLKFHIAIDVEVTVNELLQHMKVSEIERKSAEVIKKEIRKMYLKGLELEADCLNLGHEVFKQNPSVWHAYWDHGKFPLDESSLDGITVYVSLQNSGKYKLKH
jgi:spore germination protein KC